jgi:hypothetical protein
MSQECKEERERERERDREREGGEDRRDGWVREELEPFQNRCQENAGIMILIL